MRKKGIANIVYVAIAVVVAIGLGIFAYTAMNASRENSAPLTTSTTIVQAGQTTTTSIQQATGCGDGVCDEEVGENPVTCPRDCIPNCGNGICEPELRETYQNCGDCPPYIVDPDTGKVIVQCGDGYCNTELGETPTNCPTDCHE